MWKRLISSIICLICLVYICATSAALDLRPTVSPWLEDGTNTYLRVQRNVCIGTGPTATDALSLCTSPVASATRALLNLSNTALSGGSAQGTYLGANPAACTGNFWDLQLADAARSKLTCAGVFTVTTYTGQTSIVTLGTITTGTWNATLIALAYGGTNANLTADNGGIFYSTATAGAILGGTATASKMLLSGSTAAPTWSTSTIPSSAGATANKVLLSDGTNYALSTPTFPNASATTGKFIRSDGTNWVASTPTLPTSTAVAGKLLRSDATNYVESTPTFPDTAPGSGRYLKGDGTNWGVSSGSASGVGSCTNQVVTALSSDAAPTCTTITSAYVDGSIALTGSSLGQFASTTSAQLAALLSNETGTGLAVFSIAPVFTSINNNLSIFAATTSAQLAGVLSDETGTGLAVFATSPTLTSPVIADIAPGANFTLTQNSVIPFTSVNTGAVVDTMRFSLGNVGINTAVATEALERLQVRSGKVVLEELAAYATTKFNSQGTSWSTFGAAPSIIFNAQAATRPEIAWIRGGRTYPEFALREHTTADTGGEIYAGNGTVAPTLVAKFTSATFDALAYKVGGTAGTSVTYTMCKTGACATTCTIISTGGIVTGGTC